MGFLVPAMFTRHVYCWPFVASAVIFSASSVTCQMCTTSWEIESRHESNPNMAGPRAFQGNCICHDWSLFLHLTKLIQYSWYSWAMWQFPWGCYPSVGRPLTPTLCDHQGQLGGQAQWQYPGIPILPQGHLQGFQNPPTIVDENNPIPFPPTPPTLTTGPPIHAGPPIPSPLVNLHPGSELQPPDLMTQMGQLPTGSCHLGSDQYMSRPPVTPTSLGDIDFKALEDRLKVTLTQKLETMAKDLKASWTSPTRSSPVDPSLVSGSSTSARLLPGSLADSTNTGDDQYQPVANEVGSLPDSLQNLRFGYFFNQEFGERELAWQPAEP